MTDTRMDLIKQQRSSCYKAGKKHFINLDVLIEYLENASEPEFELVEYCKIWRVEV